MNYNEIILQGYFNENHRDFLKNYFSREFKKAEKENYSADEFYNGCLKVIKHFETEINMKYQKRKGELHFLLNGVEQGTVDTGNDDPEQIKEYCKTELEAISRNDFSVTLRHGDHLWNNDILYIKAAILEAQNIAEPKPEQRIKSPKPTIDDDINTADEIIEPLKGYWNRKEILNQNDFNRLKKYIESIIRNDSMPEQTETFKRTGTTNDFIRKTIYEVYRKTGKKNRKLYIELIHLFKQFAETESTTTDRKFSNYQGNYNNDIDRLITY